MKNILQSLMAGVLLALLATFPACAADLTLAGTWQLNAEKSHVSIGELPAKLEFTIASEAIGFRFRSSELIAGKAGGSNYQARADGKDYPVGGSAAYDSVAVTKVDDHTFHMQMRKQAAIMVDVTYTVSPDGKSLRCKGVALQGNRENHFDEWFDRQ